ncbi:MAG: hypothetical protein NVSMB22_26550 [Chloroflexota bacterium]
MVIRCNVMLLVLGLTGVVGGFAQTQPAWAQGTGMTQVTMQNFQFAPKSLTVVVGATVTWTNTDAAPHTATSDDGRWTTKLLQTNQSGSVTFNAVGTFSYHCTVHPLMKATIIVQAPQGSGVPLRAAAVSPGGRYLVGRGGAD